MVECGLWGGVGVGAVIAGAELELLLTEGGRNLEALEPGQPRAQSCCAPPCVLCVCVSPMPLQPGPSGFPVPRTMKVGTLPQDYPELGISSELLQSHGIAG